MELLVEVAPTKEKAIEKIRKKYGDRVNILRTQRNNRSFFFGLIERVSVEIFFLSIVDRNHQYTRYPQCNRVRVCPLLG